ncbi:MAG TPA: flap endonuclease, partial [Firmicutes bacterium]|nr:flap endonuclease [Bacillota bacterium]
MFYGIPAPIRNSKGKDIRSLIGFIGSIKKIVNEFKPYSLYVIFDSETSKNSNLVIDKEYKSNRVDYSSIPEEENPFSQLSLIKKSLKYLNIAFKEVENNEADDFIASIVSNYINEYQYIIV